MKKYNANQTDYKNPANCLQHRIFLPHKKQLLAVLTALCLAAGLPETNVLAASSASGQDYVKNENVYARLGASGTSSDAYVVNAFDVKNSSDITDYGSYSEVKNLTDLSLLEHTADSTRISAETGKFYYQGALEEAELPWLFSIQYQLDGNKITPEDLGGNDGSLKISLNVRKNPKAKDIFYENYVMQISLTLDGEKCTDIVAPDASIADAGANRQLTFTLMPKTDAAYTIEADVTDFTMSGFSIAAVPYSMNIDTEGLGTDELTGQFSELTDAVAQLNDGTKKLSDGIRELNNGGNSLLEGSSQMKNGLAALSGSSTDLTDASYQIGSSLDLISRQLDAADFSSMDSLTALPAALDQLGGALAQMKGGLAQLNGGFSQSFAALDTAVAAAAVEAPTESEMAALQTAAAANPEIASASRKLLAAYQNLMILRETYAAVKPGFEAITTSLDPNNTASVIAGLDTVTGSLHTMSTSMSASLEGVDLSSMLGQLKTGLTQLTAGYAEFHKGLTAYTDGVSALSEGYTQYDDGLRTYLNGVGELDNGSGELADGMQEFSDGVGDMPDQMQTTIDEMMEQYSSSDFDAVSFVDTRNENINSVQFILSTDGVELPKEAAEPEPEKEEGFFDRLKNLFS